MKTTNKLKGASQGSLFYLDKYYTTKPQLQGLQEVLAVISRTGSGWWVILNIGWVGSGGASPGSTRYSSTLVYIFHDLTI